MLPETVPVEIRHDGGAKKPRLGERFISPEDKAASAVEKNRTNLANGFYTNGSDEVGANFSEWKNLSLVEEQFGKLAASLGREDIVPASRHELFDAGSSSR